MLVAYGLVGGHRVVFANRAILWLVDGRRAGDEHARLQTCEAQRVQQPMRGENVDLVGLERMLPRLPDVRGAGQVVDGGRRDVANRLLDSGAIQHLDRLPPDRIPMNARRSRWMVPADDGRVALREDVEEMPADEAGGSRHEDGGHRVRRRANSCARQRLPYCAS